MLVKASFGSSRVGDFSARFFVKVIPFWAARREKGDNVLLSKVFILIFSGFSSVMESSARASASKCFTMSNVFSVSVRIFFVQFVGLISDSRASRFAEMAATGVFNSWPAFAIKVFWES